MAKAEQACLNTDWQIQALHKQRSDDLQRHERYQEMAKILRKNRRKEIEVLNAMMEEEANKVKMCFKLLAINHLNFEILQNQMIKASNQIIFCWNIS